MISNKNIDNPGDWDITAMMAAPRSTDLMRAIRKKDKDYSQHRTATLFLEQYKDQIYAANAAGLTPLHMAAYRGFFHIVQAIHFCALDEERDVIDVPATPEKPTPLWMASANPDIDNADVITFMLQNIVFPQLILTQVNAQRRTILHNAAQFNHLNTAKRLSKWPQLLNATTQENNTPAHIAAMHGHVDLFKILCDAGADMTLTNDQGKTPLEFLAANVSAQMLTNNNAAAHRPAILPRPPGKRPLSEISTAEKCLHPTSTPFMKSLWDNDSNTPLHQVIHDRLIYTTNAFGYAAIHVASYRGYPGIVKAIYDRAAQDNKLPMLDCRSQDGISPLWLAVISLGDSESQSKIIEFLIEHGANPLITNAQGETLLHCAVKLMRVGKMKALLDQCPQLLEMRDNAGRTPLDVVMTFPGHEHKQFKSNKIYNILLERSQPIPATRQEAEPEKIILPVVESNKSTMEAPDDFLNNIWSMEAELTFANLFGFNEDGTTNLNHGWTPLRNGHEPPPDPKRLKESPSPT